MNDERFSDKDFEPPERRNIRRHINNLEFRERIRKAFKSWIGWIVATGVALLTLKDQIIQMLFGKGG